MATPTIPQRTAPQAAALQNTVDALLGVRYMAHGASKSTNPTGREVLTSMEYALHLLVEKCIAGAAIPATGLNIQVYPINWMLAGLIKSYAGTDSFALTANSTNYIYLDSAPLLQKNLVGFPAGDNFKIAIAVTDGSGITTMVDCRQMNFGIGIVNSWWTVPPTAALAMNDQAINALKQIDFTNPTTLTLNNNSSGTITVTHSLHLVDTFSAGASGNLDFITSGAGNYGRLLILGSVNAGRVVTVRSSGNILLLDGNFVMDSPNKLICLMEWDGGFKEVSRNFFSLSQLALDLDANNMNISNLGALHFRTQQTLTIASGAVDMSNLEWIDILNEAAAANDDLDTISGGSNGSQITIQPRSAAQVVTVRHNGGGTGNIRLANQKPFVMSDVTDVLTLRRDSSVWNEVSRSRTKLSDLVGTGNSNAYPIDVPLVGGNLSVGVLKYERVVSHPFVFVRAHARVGTAPTTQNIIIDVRKNGTSVYSSQAEMINITPGTNGGSSAVKSPPVSFVANDIITFEIEQVGSGTVGADLSITNEAYTAAITPPV